MLKLTAFVSLLEATLMFGACTVIGAQSWTTHEDRAGFTIEIPKDWKVRNDEGRITAAGPGMERVTIYPLRIEGQLDANRARHLLVGISSQLWPGQRWNMPNGGWQFGPNGVRSIGADESRLRETSALWWMNTNQGATGFFYGVAAQPSRFQATEPVFARILGSFRVTQASAQTDGPPSDRSFDPLAELQFMRWMDPTENAFTVEVPAGWRVSGGIKRIGTTAKVSEIVAQSPDGQILRSGDVSIPHQFMEPNATLDGLGYREGGTYPGTSTPIIRFMTGLDFATSYIQRNVGQICNQVQWVRRNDRRDYIQALASRGLLLERNQYSAGEVIFTCQSGRGPYVGYLFVETSRNSNAGVGNIWNVTRLDGFLAPTNRATQADLVLQRLLASFTIDARWWAREVGTDARIQENHRRYREFSANLQQQTQNDRWASWERRTEQTQDILRGQTRVVDPETGTAYKVAQSSNYYWIDPRNEVIAGTNIPYKPTWDFREMIQTYR
jgi:hypothetical protein